MQSEQLKNLVVESLEELKAVDLRVLELGDEVSIADFMVIASGTSNRHVKSLAETVQVKAKEAGQRPLGSEGADVGEWILVDLGDVVVHVMLPRVRDFYNLEKLWGDDLTAAVREANATGD